LAARSWRSRELSARSSIQVAHLVIVGHGDDWSAIGDPTSCPVLSKGVPATPRTEADLALTTGDPIAANDGSRAEQGTAKSERLRFGIPELEKDRQTVLAAVAKGEAATHQLATGQSGAKGKPAERMREI